MFRAGIITISQDTAKSKVSDSLVALEEHCYYD